VTVLKVWNPYDRLTSADLNAQFANVQKPEGVVASAAGFGTQATPVTLTTLIAGKAAYLAGGRIVTPRAGLWLVHGVVSFSGQSTGVLTVQFIGSPAIAEGLPNLAVATNGAIATAFGVPLVLPSGQTLTLAYSHSTGAGTFTVNRLGFTFLGTGYSP
jgi:hypothetical protein